ncbi:MAG: helix-turn-helix domain-containing protein [Lachnospiraceae bacterium]|nr:helix-turn-helix domain-containing protein [Lachnospiraceae bacterium]
MNILIIDDEPLVLQNVSEKIRDMGFGLKRVDCAGSTAAADALLEERRYDIFLCDIVMPGEDGISFAKRRLEQDRDCKFIFLTAHADYQYMKEAITLQSFDYVLQPVTQEELRSVLENAILQLTIERKNRKLMQVGELFENEQEEILDGNAMRYLLGLTDNSMFLRHLVETRTQAGVDEHIYLPVLASVVRSHKEWDEGERYLLRCIYSNVVDELTADLSTENIVILRSDRQGSFILLLCFSGSPASPDRVTDTLETIRVIFQKSLRIGIAIYYGGMCRFEELREFFSGIVQEQSSNVTRGSGLYQVGKFSRQNIDEYSLESQKRVWQSLLKNDETVGFRDSVLRFVRRRTEAGDLNREVLTRLHQVVSELILGYMVSNSINSMDVFDEELSYTDFMYCWDSSEAFESALSQVVEKIYRRGRGGDVILEITTYIADNLDREIYVSEIADQIGMNPEYLTRVFKKEKGVSLKRYIDNERIEHAIRLLETTDLTVKEISDRSGYASYTNFTRAFKQHTGKSPSDYRKGE